MTTLRLVDFENGGRALACIEREQAYEAGRRDGIHEAESKTLIKERMHADIVLNLKQISDNIVARENEYLETFVTALVATYEAVSPSLINSPVENELKIRFLEVLKTYTHRPLQIQAGDRAAEILSAVVRDEALEDIDIKFDAQSAPSSVEFVFGPGGVSFDPHQIITRISAIMSAVFKKHQE